MNVETQELQGRIKYLEDRVDDIELTLSEIRRDLDFIEDMVRDLR
jgi:prefoldin subunit 5